MEDGLNLPAASPILGVEVGFEIRRRMEIRMHVDGKGPNGAQRPEGQPAGARVIGSTPFEARSDAARLARARARLASGFYDQPDVMLRTAWLILKSDDLRGPS